jgi:sRNA-binding regulator protein Hfq
VVEFKKEHVKDTRSSMPKESKNPTSQKSSSSKNKETQDDKDLHWPTAETGVDAWLSSWNIQTVAGNLITTHQQNDNISFISAALSEGCLPTDENGKLPRDENGEIIGKDALLTNIFNQWKKDESRKPFLCVALNTGRHWVYLLCREDESKKIECLVMNSTSTDFKQSIRENLGDDNIEIQSAILNCQGDSWNCGVWVLALLEQTLLYNKKDTQKMSEISKGLVENLKTEIKKNPIGNKRDQFEKIFRIVQPVDVNESLEKEGDEVLEKKTNEKESTEEESKEKEKKTDEKTKNANSNAFFRKNKPEENSKNKPVQPSEEFTKLITRALEQKYTFELNRVDEVELEIHCTGSKESNPTKKAFFLKSLKEYLSKEEITIDLLINGEKLQILGEVDVLDSVVILLKSASDKRLTLSPFLFFKPKEKLIEELTEEEMQSEDKKATCSIS